MGSSDAHAGHFTGLRAAAVRSGGCRFALLRPGRGPGLAVAAIAALTVAGCMSTSENATPSVAAAAPAAYGRERLIGRWGVASYHTESDRARSEREAKGQCSQPYKITKGPTDGVMMHVADDPKLYELRLKGDTAGRTYVGFEAPPGDAQDREILSATNSVLVMRFVDPEVNGRYGTYVYVRCGG